MRGILCSSGYHSTRGFSYPSHNHSAAKQQRVRSAVRAPAGSRHASVPFNWLRPPVSERTSSVGVRRDPSVMLCRSSTGNCNAGNGTHEAKQGSSRSSKPDGRQQAGPGAADQHVYRHHPKYSNAPATGSETGADVTDPEDAAGADEECDTNKYQESQPNDDKLKAIMCWDADGKLPKNHTSRRGVLNQVQLSTYGDSIGRNLKDLTTFLDHNIKDAVGSLHLLPIYPSTGDRGFGPVTYENIDPELGSWADVQALADRYQLCLEFMVNHLSPKSPQFQDFLEHGDKSKYADMFVKWNKIWPKGGPTAEQLQKIRTRKAEPPLLEVILKDGSAVPIWCTFGPEQMDIDPFSEEGWKFIEESLKYLCEKGQTKLIRLDAFGYVTKKAGTSCFMLEPSVWKLLDRIKQVVKPYGVQMLCEVHEDFNLNIELARHGYWVYDFALPLLMLHALYMKTAEPLKHWLSICPRRQITTLDTHDGMGVDDITGLAPLCVVPELEKAIINNGGTINYKHFYTPAGQFEPDAKNDLGQDDKEKDCKRTRECLRKVAKYLQPDCLEGCYKSVPHQYNETYFSAVGEDPKSYLLARAVQFFTPGIPMIYYVGLLAGRDDFELLQKGSIRDINRHYYSLEEAQAATRRPVVQALLQLCRFRNTHPAFRGRVFVDDTTPEHELHVRWYSGTQHLAVLRVNFQTRDFAISHSHYDPEALPSDVAALDARTGSDVSPYSLGVLTFSSLDRMDTETRAKYRRQMAEAVIEAAESGGTVGIASMDGDGGGGWSLEAEATADDKLAEGEGLTDARKSQRTGVPNELLHVIGRDQQQGRAKKAGADGSSENGNGGKDAALSAAQAAAAEASEQASLDASESSGGSESEEDTEGVAGAGTDGHKVELQHLDFSWAWDLPDEPITSPEKAAAAAGQPDLIQR